MMSGYRIPFNKPAVLGNEFAYIQEAIWRGKISGDGHFTRLCQEMLAKITGAPAALLTTSCTHALEMAALLLNIKRGDEVIVPSFTFVSTANAFVLRGAKPVFADIRADTLNLDEVRLERLITPRTKAIVVVHYAGIGCEMDAILEIAARHGVPVIEDNAHGLFGEYRGKPLGSFGTCATQSFHETKNISCGEGGALILNDAGLNERAEILREKGTDRSKFFRGQVDKYTWVDVGSSYVMSDCLAAFLYAQLENAERIQSARQAIWERYNGALSDWAQENSVFLPHVPAHCKQSFHMFHLLLPREEMREAFIRHLENRGILSVFHYVPLHLAPMGRKFGGRLGMCPVSETVSERIVRLPMYYDLSGSEQATVIEAVRSFQVDHSSVLFALNEALLAEQPSVPVESTVELPRE
jgi:dTDP-4-amino-4,6-dideoxygalactose transaminase